MALERLEKLVVLLGRKFDREGVESSVFALALIVGGAFC